MTDMTAPVGFNGEYPRSLRVAAIGCGGHAVRNIFPTFPFAPVDLVAVCDLDRSRAEHAARLFGGKTVYTDHREMLDKERPEVVIAVLSYDEKGHPRYPAVAIDAMNAGADVWIEKPPAARADEIREMMQVSARTGKQVGVGFKKMFAPANVKAREIIRLPEFGPISTLTARYPQSLPSTEERGDDRKMCDFLDHVVHPYAAIRALGGPIESLRVEREARTGGSLTIIRFTNGAVGSLHLPARPGSGAPLERTEVVGSGASVVIENNLRVTYFRPGSGHGSPRPYGRTGFYYGDNDSAPLAWEPEFSLGQLYNKGLFLLGYAPEIRYFCETILNNGILEMGNLEDALELLLVYEAYRRPDGERVMIQPV